MTRLFPGYNSRFQSILAIAAFLAALSGGIRAAHGAAVGVGTQLGQFGIAGYSGSLTPGYQTAASGSRSEGRTYTLGATSTFAAYGALTVTATYTSPDTTLGTHFARASAYFADTVTIDAPGLTGQQGSLTFSFKLEGPLVANGPGGIDQQAKVYYGWGSDAGDGSIPSMNGYIDYNAMRSSSGWNGGDFGIFVGTTKTATIGFTYGQPFDFWVNIAAQTEILHSEPGNASAVFSVSNFSGFKDLPAGATVTSVSGTDWTKSVANHFSSPPVSLAPPNAGSVKLAWPTNNVGGFVLEYTTSLSPPNWLIGSETAAIEGSQNVINLQILPDNRYYRLRRP